jgi:putative SOS response-associated peptidase YedK
MWGRLTLFTNPHLFAEVLGAARTFDDDWTPAYNIAPTQKVLCVRAGDQREFFRAKWGLIPSWAKDAKIGASCINARVETVDTKPAFSSAFKKRRCLVIAGRILRVAPRRQATVLRQPQIARADDVRWALGEGAVADRRVGGRGKDWEGIPLSFPTSRRRVSNL